MWFPAPACSSQPQVSVTYLYSKVSVFFSFLGPSKNIIFIGMLHARKYGFVNRVDEWGKKVTATVEGKGKKSQKNFIKYKEEKTKLRLGVLQED